MVANRNYALDLMKFMAAIMITNSHFQPLYKNVNESLGNGPWLNKTEVLYNPCPQVNRTNVPKKTNPLRWYTTQTKRI